MGIYKRGGVYWYRFNWNGERIRESTKQTNKRVAQQMEAAHRTSLAKGEVGIRERNAAPTLRGFQERFERAIESGSPKTARFYKSMMKPLLRFDAIANTRLSDIDEALIQRYVE